MKATQPLLLLAVALQHSCASAAEQLHSALQYIFTPEICSKAIHTLSTEGLNGGQKVVRDVHTTDCAPQLGVTSSEAAIDDDVFGLRLEGSDESILTQDIFTNEGVSFEIWIKTGDRVNDKLLRPILTLGRRSDFDPKPLDITSCDKNGFDLLLGQRADYLVIHYRTSDTVFLPCQEHAIKQTRLEENTMFHVAITLRDGQQQVFINGQASATLSEPFSNDLTHWEPHYSLYMFAHPSKSTAFWHGTIYKFAAYVFVLSSMNVQSLLLDGLPPTAPYALNYTVAINEDAEPFALTHEPEWYRMPTSVQDADRIKLKVEWVDQSVRDLLHSVNLTTSPRDSSPVYIYVTTLPTKGHVYFTDGAPIGDGSEESAAILDRVTDSDNKIVFLPPWNEHSDLDSDEPFASIDYCVSDILLFEAQQCRFAGTVHIKVQSVNDPPVAIRIGTITVREGIETPDTPKIYLTGTDVDEGDSIQQVRIKDLPRFGYLVLTVSSFRSDGLEDGTRLSDLKYVVNGSDKVAVKYITYPIRSSRILVKDKTAKDSFTFQVADQSGLWSREETVKIQIVSAVTAQSDEVVSVEEDSQSKSNVILSGSDGSGYTRPITFFVKSVTSGDTGVLLDSESGEMVQPMQMLPYKVSFPYETQIPLTFIPAPGFCNSHVESPGSEITYVVLALDDEDDRVLSVSNTARLRIEVKCSIDALELSVSTGVREVAVSSLHKVALDPCNATTEGKAEDLLSTCLVINGLSVISNDLHDELVHVTVSTGRGQITFNKDSWNLTTPVFGRRELNSGNATFYAYPRDLTDILSGLTYQTFQQGRDAVNIQLQYGACSSLTNASLLSPMSSAECQILQRTYNITIREGEAPDIPSWRQVTALLGFIVGAVFTVPLVFGIWVWIEAYIMAIDNDDDDDDDTVEDPENAATVWIKYYDEDSGNYYYENRLDGTVTWEAPVGREGDIIVDPYREDEECKVEVGSLEEEE